MSQDSKDPDMGKIADFLENPEKYYYPIKWYVGAVRIGRHKFNLGYCTYAKGTAFIATDGLTPIIVADVRVVDGRCSDAKWCINLSCPLSKPDLEYMKKFGIKNKEDLQKFYERIKEIEKKLDEIGFGMERAKTGITLFKKPMLRIEKRG